MVGWFIHCQLYIARGAERNLVVLANAYLTDLKDVACFILGALAQLKKSFALYLKFIFLIVLLFELIYNFYLFFLLDPFTNILTYI